jgi:hypothetical protein
MKMMAKNKAKETTLTKKLLDGVPIGTIIKGECMEWNSKLKKEVPTKMEWVKICKNCFYSENYGTYSTREILDDNVYSISIPTKHDFVKTKQILDGAERRYLGDVIRPFKDRVQYITKETGYEYDKEKIRIQLEGNNDFELPEFKEDTMYKNMELNKEYTLDQLCL